MKLILANIVNSYVFKAPVEPEQSYAHFVIFGVLACSALAYVAWRKFYAK
jgi:hypothetical protein